MDTHRPLNPFRPALLACLAACLPLMAQEAGLTGTVTDPAGRPVAGARVTLLPAELTTRTGPDGSFTLRRSVALRHTPAGTGRDASETAWRIDLFDVQGRRLAPALPAPPEAGSLPLPAAARRGLVLARLRGPGGERVLRLAGETRALRLDPVSAARPLAKGPTDAATGLPSAGAPPETLEVVAYGFSRAERLLAHPADRQDVRLEPLAWRDVPYKSGSLTAYERERCKVDVHAPAGARNLPVLVHLHGGGLHGGDKTEGWLDYDNFFARKLMEQGLLIVSPNYRLGYDPDLPKTGVRGAFPDYLRDAAAAVAWAWRNAEAYGGDRDRFIVGGYSAGAWLAALLTLDTSYYRAAGFAPARVDGVLAFSVQTYTYPQVAWERGTPVRELSDAAMLSFVRGLETPMHLFLGGGEPERLAENREFVEAMRRAGTADIRLDVMPGRDHKQLVTTMGNASDATRDLALAFIRRVAP